MTAIHRSDVPYYLRAGSFFQNLDPYDEGVFDVPDHCFKLNTKIESKEDFCQLLCSLLFWGVDDIPIDAFIFAVNLNSFELMRDLIQQFPPFESLLRKIVQVGEATAEKRIQVAVKSQLGIDTVRYLVQQGYEMSTEACEAAASVGDVDILTLLRIEGCPWDEKVVTEAVIGEHYLCLEYALQSGCPLPERITLRAAATGNINILQCFRDHNISWDRWVIGSAVASKNLECVRYLRENGCEISVLDCCTAVNQDSIECLEYLHQNGGNLVLVGLYAATRGSLVCLQYFHEHGGEWHARCCTAAAENGHLECLKYAHEHGCPWEDETVKSAFRNGHYACVWYAVRRGCTWYELMWLALKFVGLLLAVHYCVLPDDYIRLF